MSFTTEPHAAHGTGMGLPESSSAMLMEGSHFIINRQLPLGSERMWGVGARVWGEVSVYMGMDVTGR